MAFEGVTVACCGGAGESTDGEVMCICGADERVLRAYIREDKSLPPMNIEQREWCLKEIEGVEGYTRSDFEGECDGGLARGVLDAWQDYCRDKGLL